MEFIKLRYSLKVVLVGDSGVGKTNIIYRYTKNSAPSENVHTLNNKLFFKNTKIKNKKIRLEIWDTADQEEEIIPYICQGVHGGFIVYDISQSESFDNVDFWFNVLKESLPENSPIILLGNKSDLNDDRVIEEEEGKKKAEDLDIIFYETCASTKKNIKEVFDELLKKIFEKMEKDEIEEAKKEIEEERREIEEARKELEEKRAEDERKRKSFEAYVKKEKNKICRCC